MKKLFGNCLVVLLSIAVLAHSAFAAIGVSEPAGATETASSTDATSYTGPGPWTPAANSILVAGVAATSTVLANPTMTGGGLTWTLRSSSLYNAISTVYVFTAVAGASPSSTTITFDCTGDGATGAVIGVVEVTGGNTSNPVRQFKANNATSTNPTWTLDTAMDTNNGYFAFYGAPKNPPGTAAPTSWTLSLDTGHTSPTNGAAGAFRAGGETGTTVTFTDVDSLAWGGVAIEICEASNCTVTGNLISQNNVNGGTEHMSGGAQ